MSEPVKIKLDEQKNSKQNSFTVDWKGSSIKSYLETMVGF